MIYKTKYIITTFRHIEQPFLFSELATHAEVARAVGGTVIGAGFCYISTTPVGPRYKCYGESVSLQVKSREDVDAVILNRLLGLAGDDL